MLFLRRRREPSTEPFWEAVEAARDDAPVIVRELLRDRQVVTSAEEANEAIAWAKQRDGWSEPHVPLYLHRT